MSVDMNRRNFVGMVGAGLAGTAFAGRAAFGRPERKPNIVIIFCDDQGYGDVGCYGAQGFETPNLDRMAREGMRFTDFHASTAVCSASRALVLALGMLVLMSILGALGPNSKIGINENETLLPEILKAEGYTTAIYGKWHLGDAQKFLPVHHGFDDYFGLPYSNDMWPHHPTAGAHYPPLPLIEKDTVIDYLEDQTYLTTWYTDRAVNFIRENAARPFFLYVPHSMPHVPLFVSEKFRGKSKQGMYGDVIMEIDWSAGQILNELKEQGIDDDTLVIFTSDNGPWLSYGDHAGSAGPLREGKGTMFEGGMREPCIMRWPGRIPAGTTCNRLATTMDILPTVTNLAGGTLPGHTIDGVDIGALLMNPEAESPRKVYYCYYGRGLEAVREGNWKLHFPHAYRTLAGRPGGTGGQPVPYSQETIGLALFDLDNDIGESNNLAHRHPEIVRRLQAIGDEARQDLGDRLTGVEGSGVREAGRI